MKRFTPAILMLIAVFSFTQLGSAQTVGKAAWMIGGSAGFSSQKYKDADKSTTYINISPNVGYFFADDLAVGLNVAFFSTSFDGNSASSFGVGPFVRYYVTNPIFIQVGADFTLSSDFGDENNVLFGAAVGYSWFLNNDVAIEPALFFNINNNDGDTNDFTVFGLSIGVQAFANHHHGMEE